MTITIGKRFLLAVLVLLLIAGAGAGGYQLGRDSKDVGGAVKRAKTAAFERGRAQGDQEGRGAIVRELRGNRQQDADSDVIEYLGYDRTDWKDDSWYLVHMIKRVGTNDAKIVSVNDRKLMLRGSRTRCAARTSRRTATSKRGSARGRRIRRGRGYADDDQVGL